MSQTRRAHNEGPHVLTEGTMTGNTPTMRRRQLGEELRRLREAAGKTQEDVHRYTNVPATTISRMETGKRRVSVTFLKAVLPLYGVGSPLAEDLERLARESSGRGWWVGYGDIVPVWFGQFLGMETAADELWTYESEYVPGILQTSRYTEATRTAMATVPSEGSEKLVAVRSTRQKRIANDAPVILKVVLNEAVLRRVVGAPDVMREQLAYLIEAAARPNVTLQVLPFAAGAHPGMLGPFTALRFRQQSLNTIYIELDGGAVYWDKPLAVERYTASFRRLTELALSEKDTISLLKETERGY